MSSALFAPQATGLHPQSYQRTYTCRCGRPVFFRNSVCVYCASPLGYEPQIGKVYSLREGHEAGTWLLDGEVEAPFRNDILYRSCVNLSSACGCNWLVEHAEAHLYGGMCMSCRLNRFIPDLSDPARSEGWNKIELAKRRLISSLLSLGLPVQPSLAPGDGGLVFDFLAAQPGGPAVMTGHENGTITLNIEEADDAARERNRAQMHEPYRTLLGHLRHEVGHYYWDRLLANTGWLNDFRDLFGDERQDYGAALQRHYDQGPPAGWQEQFVTAYAASHPWEDWAETWAHYLHMEDTLSTAKSFSLNIDSVEVQIDSFRSDDLWQQDEQFLNVVHSWIRLTAVLNELSRSMGLPDFYPFVVSKASLRKLHFVHRVISGA